MKKTEPCAKDLTTLEGQGGPGEQLGSQYRVYDGDIAEIGHVGYEDWRSPGASAKLPSMAHFAAAIVLLTDLPTV